MSSRFIETPTGIIVGIASIELVIRKCRYKVEKEDPLHNSNYDKSISHDTYSTFYILIMSNGRKNWIIYNRYDSENDMNAVFKRLTLKLCAEKK